MTAIKPVDELGPDYQVHNRVPLTKRIAELGTGIHTINERLRSTDDAGEVDHILSIVDTETTGLDHKEDEIIEIGILNVGINKNGHLIKILSSLNYLQEPTKQLEPIITEVTGLTDEDLINQTIPDGLVQDFVKNASLIVAHNAKFDRAFFDRAFPGVDKRWACSSRGDIDWKSLGFKSSGLENILTQMKFFYDAHRASVDCMATAWALVWEPNAMMQLLNNSQQPSFNIKALGSPFSTKDDLKAAGYQWDPANKVWHITVLGETRKDEQIEMLQKLYGGGKMAKVVEQSPDDKYKS